MNKQAQQVILRMISLDRLPLIYPMDGKWDHKANKYVNACNAYNGKYWCTRSPKHDGPHVAHTELHDAGPKSNVCGAWIDESQI